MLLIDELQLLGWLALATASVSFTITKTQMFDFVRDRLPEGKVSELMHCPYCMAHYVAMFFVALYDPTPFTGRWYDFIACVFIVVTLATLVIQVISLIARILNVLVTYDPTMN